MKLLSDGKVKLSRGERRIGNFVIGRESGHVKLSDIHGMYSIRVSTRMPIGIWLDNMLALKDGGEGTIKTYVATMWSLLSAVPDDEMIHTLINETTACIERHRDWYGDKGEATPEEDAEALEQVKAMKDLEEQLMNLKEDVD